MWGEVTMLRLFTRIISNYKIYSSFIKLSRRLSNQVDVKSEIFGSVEDASKLSTLFVSGRHGADIYQIVKPFVDINYMTENLESLKLSCYHRGIHIDLEYVLKLSAEWLHARDEYLAVVEKNQVNLKEINLSASINNTDDFKILNNKRNEIIGKINAEKMKLYDIEDVVMPLLKKIPHILHADTPLQSNVIDTSYEPQFRSTEIKSHSIIVKHLLHFTNCPSTSYFMTGKLSELEYAVQLYFTDKVNEYGFLPLSCIDFCKSFIMEAVGHDPYSSIKMKEKGSREIGQKLHLVGAASFETFCAYLTNMNINKSTLPIKYISIGRRYNGRNKGSNVQNLFTVVQSNNIHFLQLSELSSVNLFNMLLQLIRDWYSELKIPFRVVNVVARKLTTAESQRKQLELWSPALKDYVPVAYVSQHDDFVSKRLQITYGIQHIKEGYCHIIEGALVNIPVLIGCIVENFQISNNDFNIPNVLKKYMLQ